MTCVYIRCSFFARNAQGDIVAIYAHNGTKIGTYTYDAWGSCTVTAEAGISTEQSDVLHTLNPFRYRSYFCDLETGLYYLQSRYYNPEWGRFLNADSMLQTDLGTNMFTYCGNNPVIRVDYTGHAWDVILDIVSLGFSIADVVSNTEDYWAWIALGIDVACLIVPFASGGGAAVKAASKVDDVADVVKTANAVDNVTDVAKVAGNAGDAIGDATKVTKIHGNSLKTSKETIGYALRKNGTGEILKFGETTRGTKRYSNKFYRQMDAYMDPMAKGSKYEMHIWQHNQIVDYYNKYGVRPPLNKSFW